MKMKAAFDEFLKNEITVGSVVKVKDWGYNYPTCYDWFIYNDIPRDLCTRYAYGQEMAKQNEYVENDTFKVLAVHDGKALIAPSGMWGDSPCYLIGINGLIVVTK